MYEFPKTTTQTTKSAYISAATNLGIVVMTYFILKYSIMNYKANEITAERTLKVLQEIEDIEKNIENKLK